MIFAFIDHEQINQLYKQSDLPIIQQKDQANVINKMIRPSIDQEDQLHIYKQVDLHLWPLYMMYVSTP